LEVDVTFEGLDESLRFIIECKARIFQQYERFAIFVNFTIWFSSSFWFPPPRAVSETYRLLAQKTVIKIFY